MNILLKGIFPWIIVAFLYLLLYLFIKNVLSQNNEGGVL